MPSVVQRQLWLMHNLPGMTRNQAYDTARKEFYQLRQQEEVERRVAKEEALWTGAYFGKGALEIGMELEDETYEKWKAWALKEIEAINLERSSAYTTAGAESEDTVVDPLDTASEEATPL